MRLPWTRAMLALGMLGALACADAHDEHALHYDQVDLSASAEQEVQNDLLIATLYTEHEGRRQAEIAEQVNATMAWALARAKSVAGVTAQTTQYNTYPVYANDGTTLTGWRARQAVRLEARDAKVLGDLIASLQQRLAIEAIGFSVSKESRDRTETALTTEALAQFQARARQVAAALGRGGYRVVRLNLGTGDNMPPPLMQRGAAMMLAEKAATPAQLAAGTQTMNVTVAGTIQLDAP